MTDDLDLRDVLARLIKQRPNSITLTGGVLVVELDDHVSDESVAASRVRTIVIVRPDVPSQRKGSSHADATATTDDATPPSRSATSRSTAGSTRAAASRAAAAGPQRSGSRRRRQP